MDLVRWNGKTWVAVEDLDSMQELVRLNVRTQPMHDGRLYATVADTSEFLQRACMNGAKHAEGLLLEIRASCVRLSSATQPRRRLSDAWDRLLMDV